MLRILQWSSTGTITNTTANGSAQTLQAANKARKVIMIQNTSDTAMYVRFGAAASATAGFTIAPGATWENPPHYCPNGLVSVFGTNTKTYAYLIY